MPARRFDLVVLLFICPIAAAADDDVAPLPLPKTIRVQSGAPRGKVWESLSPKDKQLVIHLTNAANAGRELLFYRNHRHAIAVKHLLEEAFSAEHLNDTKTLLGDKAFAELLLYGAKFLDQGGPYAPSNRKYILTEVTPGQLEKLVTRHLAHADAETRSQINRLLTEPSYEVQQYPENPQGDGLERTGGNYYEKGITGKEVHLAFDKTAKLTLNGRVERSPGGPVCVPQRTTSPGLVGESLRKVVAELEAARPFSQTEYQKEQIEAMIKYFQEGDVEDFRQASISWVRDRRPIPVSTS